MKTLPPLATDYIGGKINDLHRQRDCYDSTAPEFKAIEEAIFYLQLAYKLASI